MGLIISPIVMFSIFILMVTPIGLIMRLFRFDLLDIKINKSANSYWNEKKTTVSSLKNQY